MKKITVFLITFFILWSEGYAIDATSNGGCPKGMHLIVSVPVKIKTDSKTGKETFLPQGRPSKKCVNHTSKKKTEEKKKEKPEETGSYTIQIFQYGSASGMGQTYASKKECETQRTHLAEANRGLDYTYSCIKQSK